MNLIYYIVSRFSSTTLVLSGAQRLLCLRYKAVLRCLSISTYPQPSPVQNGEASPTLETAVLRSLGMYFLPLSSPRIFVFFSGKAGLKQINFKKGKVTGGKERGRETVVRYLLLVLLTLNLSQSCGFRSNALLN